MIETVEPSRRPTFLLWGEAEDAANEDPVGDDLQPGIGKARRLGGPQDIQHVAIGREHLHHQNFFNRLITRNWE